MSSEQDETAEQKSRNDTPPPPELRLAMIIIDYASLFLGEIFCDGNVAIGLENGKGKSIKM